MNNRQIGTLRGGTPACISAFLRVEPAMRLPTVRRVIDHTFICIGAVLTIYIVTATLGWISNSSQHYTNFVLATLAMAGLLLLRNLLDEKISGNEKRFWPLRLIFGVAATVIVTAGALYLRVQALHLESVQPFFDDRDFYVGLVLLIGVLLDRKSVV